MRTAHRQKLTESSSRREGHSERLPDSRSWLRRTPEVSIEETKPSHNLQRAVCSSPRLGSGELAAQTAASKDSLLAENRKQSTQSTQCSKRVYSQITEFATPGAGSKESLLAEDKARIAAQQTDRKDNYSQITELAAQRADNN